MADYIKEKHYERTDSGIRVWGVYHIDNSACPSCITQLVLGIKETKDPIKCFYSGVPGSSADISFDINVPFDRIPDTGGTITIRKCWQYKCDDAINEYREKDAGLELFFVQKQVPTGENQVEKKPGEQISISGDVKNVGNIKIDDLRLRLRIDNTLLGFASVGELDVNESSSFSVNLWLPTDISEGTYNLWIDAYDGETPFQENIDSNWDVIITIPPQISGDIDAYSPEYKKVDSYEYVSCKARFKISGVSESVTATVKVYLYKDGSQIDSGEFDVNLSPDTWSSWYDWHGDWRGDGTYKVVWQLWYGGNKIAEVSKSKSISTKYYTIRIFNVRRCDTSDLCFDIKVTRSDGKMEKIKIYLRVTGGGYTWDFGEKEIYTGNTYSYGATYFCSLAGSGTIHVEITEGELEHISKDKSVSC